MSQAEAQAWWAEVEHLRERIERRRGESSLVSPAAGRSRPAAVSPRPDREGRSHDASFAPRRTVRIRGQAIPTVTAPLLREDSATDGPPGAAERQMSAARARRRTAARPSERLSSSPDRLALWAFGFALLLLVVAAISAHGL